MDSETEKYEEKKEPIIEGLGEPPTTTSILKRMSAVLGICLLSLALMHAFMNMWVVKCTSLRKARLSMFGFHIGIMILLAIPFLLAHSIFLGEIKSNVTIMAAKLYAIVVIPTFILLEVPITGEFINPLFENTIGISFIGLLSGIGWMPEFGNLSKAFTGQCWTVLAPGYSFPLATIMPLFNLNLSSGGTFKNKDANGVPVTVFEFESAPIKSVCDNFKVTFEEKIDDINSAFKLCVYKHSIGHAMWVFVSIMSASFAATYASF
jgi:hypothetical protein